MRVKHMAKFILALLTLSTMFLLVGCDKIQYGVLAPEGIITYAERQLLFDGVALMLIVVIPVIIMSFAFVVRYRASHKTADYKPNWSHNVMLETIWWGVPCAIIFVLGIMTWIQTHKLDPYRKIDVPGKILFIEAVALPWKWLFIYPEQNIASVNQLVLPKGQQVEFWITSDNVPMSAFFIPRLSSQIFSMAGMRTRLHLFATQIGTYNGLNAQYNGDGFSDMHFEVKVVEQPQLEQWFAQVKQSPNKLDEQAHEQLIQPTMNAPVKYFSSVKPNLFHEIIQSYLQLKNPHPNAVFEKNQF